MNVRPLVHLTRAVLEPEARAFRTRLEDPAAAHRALVSTLLEDLARTDYGGRYRVDAKVPESFEALPVVTYEDLESDIARHRREPHARALTPHRVLFYEPTSGSSGPKKLIPYTKPLKAAFARMFRLWAHDLLQHGPRFSTGRFYFSVSPRFDEDHEGTHDDSDYLDPFSRAALARFFVSPRPIEPTAARGPALAFRHGTALALLEANDLEVVSVWNPSFFSVLLDYIEEHRDALLPEVRDSRRRDGIRHALGDGRADFEALWPELKLISCWTSGHARRAAHELAARLPHATVQGKGLLATEAAITIPLVELGESDALAPLVGDVLLELEDDRGALRPLHAGVEGVEYALVISQRSGLVRYRLGDRVRLEGRIGQTPRLAFAGRGGGVSDLVGEKLNETFVERVLAGIDGLAGASTLVPSLVPRARYLLLVRGLSRPEEVVRDDVERALRHAHHYRLAQDLGQLAPLELRVVPDLERRLEAAWTKSGRTLGDMKARALTTLPLVLDED